MCAVRHAAVRVAKKFRLRKPHVWELFYCHTQHLMCVPIFIAKCHSLVEQWDYMWAESDVGRNWMDACRGEGNDGCIASTFMAMSDSSRTNNVSAELKRVGLSHVDKDQEYTPEFCRGQVQLLQQFVDILERSPASTSTVEILKQAAKRGNGGTLGNLKNVGDLFIPQLLSSFFLWGFAAIPCWRACECPILDDKKKHYQAGTNGGTDDGDAPEIARFDRIKKTDKVKSLESVHRVLCTVAHIFNTSETVAENGSCEGERTKLVQDFVVYGMDWFDFRPTANSNAYNPQYHLWWKPWGAHEAWRKVPYRNISKLLAVWWEPAKPSPGGKQRGRKRHRHARN